MPNNNQHKHLLWGLMMLQAYDEMDLTRDAAGDDGGQVDPKTV